MEQYYEETLQQEPKKGIYLKNFSLNLFLNFLFRWKIEES